MFRPSRKTVMKSALRYLTVVSACLTMSAHGQPSGNGIVFDDDHRVAVASFDRNWAPASFSVAAWVRMKTGQGSQIFVNRGAPGGLFTLYRYQGRIRMLVEYAPGKYTHANTTLPPDGVWTHYAGTYDGTRIVLYVNGKPVARKAAAGRMPPSDKPVTLGALPSLERRLSGALEHVQLWERALSADDARQVFAGELRDETVAEGRIAWWHSMSIKNGILINQAGDPLNADYRSRALPRGRTASGYRGIWYANQPLDNEYVYKYSGGLGTYCAKHIPLAVYAPQANKTFFVYGGTPPDSNRLWHMVSYFDHETGLVPRPTVLLDKKTDDAHDNPVLQIDNNGHIWVFSSSHGTARPSYIHRSVEPFDISRFEHVKTTNFSYPQPWYLPRHGFVFLHTIYRAGRALYTSRSPDGENWSEPDLLALMHQGHYQVSGSWRGKLGTAFNYHPRGKGLNWRTNLYYIESDDAGTSWHTAAGTPVKPPLRDPAGAARVHNYAEPGLNVYMKDLNFDAEGRPVVLFLTSPGFKSGPANDPRVWRTAHWTGTEWQIRGTIRSDNNYDTGCLHIEENGNWRLVAPTETGPQPYNPGGEVAMWTSRDEGATWRMRKQLTRDSQHNHTYCRRPVNAHPDFYAFWADGHGRKPSRSNLYFTDRSGSHVWRLPRVMPGETARPEVVW